MKLGFPAVSRAQWEAQVRADLKETDWEQRLVWKTPEGLCVRPYYTLEDMASLTIPLDSVPGVFPFLRGNGQSWRIAPAGEEPSAQIDASQFQEQGANTVEELALALAASVEWLANSEQPLHQAAQQLIVRYGVSTSFFLEIAKLRAARLLFSCAFQAFEPTDPAAASLHIHAVTARWNKSLLDRPNNLLRATVEALAAVLGGANWVTVRADWIEPRFARNVLLILREESHLDRVLDPAGGAWYVEALTDLLARESWKRFQELEARGGFSALRESGELEAMLTASRQAKQMAYALRRATLVGVNHYPASSEPLMELPGEEASWRAAGVFERIRMRTERHVAAGGRRPKVLLLEVGDLKMRRARSNFCRNFLGCAGFEISAGTALEPADLVVLCSSDEEYPRVIEQVVSQTRAPVLIAGYPKESIARLEAGGAAGFLYLGSNLVDTLECWQTQLGVAP
ncbi:MAG: methylmalonyl-CoA mutase family protein [Bryobacteraceae bacterium]|nr:methylmalonyl-CoA mutase family protein [Bryobacteraceae bacterium]MDW8377740.1 methylmalonyl-CoA mutase family protein [Bryobacterales bacterium]